ncbi:hypothetical protein BH09PLA1_BH09PLA1_09730 [soil metagenome]
MKLFGRLSSLTILTAHAFIASTWLVVMPGGFAIGHSRFWTNRAAPLLVLAICIAALSARALKWNRLLQHLVLIVPLAWTGAAISGIIAFPISARLVTLCALAGAAIMLWSLRP